MVSYQRPTTEYEKVAGVRISYAIMLFKKTPFTEVQVDKYRRFCEHLSAADLGYTLSYAPGVEQGEKEIQDLNNIKGDVYQRLGLNSFFSDINCDGVIEIQDLNDVKGNLWATVACP